jgi:hypothetical protein
MLSYLTVRLLSTRLAGLFAPPLAELTSKESTARVNPTSLQLLLIGFGTLAAYSWAKRWRLARRESRQLRQEMASESLAAASAPIAPPHFADVPSPVLRESAESAA